MADKEKNYRLFYRTHPPIYPITDYRLALLRFSISNGQLCFLVNAQLDLAVYNLENIQQTGFLR
ncbi:MAG: hypothetical protein ICV55_08895 [Coleofasciculus sp. C3-bin4]|nr:hypothetical protein [Coleofasciculus sp. C3-bin4]